MRKNINEELIKKKVMISDLSKPSVKMINTFVDGCTVEFFRKDDLLGIFQVYDLAESKVRDTRLNYLRFSYRVSNKDQWKELILCADFNPHSGVKCPPHLNLDYLSRPKLNKGNILLELDHYPISFEINSEENWESVDWNKTTLSIFKYLGDKGFYCNFDEFIVSKSVPSSDKLLIDLENCIAPFFLRDLRIVKISARLNDKSININELKRSFSRSRCFEYSIEVNQEIIENAKKEGFQIDVNTIFQIRFDTNHNPYEKPALDVCFYNEKGKKHISVSNDDYSFKIGNLNFKIDAQFTKEFDIKGNACIKLEGC